MNLIEGKNEGISAVLRGVNLHGRYCNDDCSVRGVSECPYANWNKAMFGDEFIDYNMVFCTPSGRPMEAGTINKMLQDLIKKHNLPKVVFHSLRHSSITYKLKLSGGDIKMVQGDSGHAQATMVTEQYAHILDDDRKQNAQRLEKAFYQGNGLPRNEMTEKKEPDTQASGAREDNLALITKLLGNPQTAELLKAIVNQM